MLTSALGMPVDEKGRNLCGVCLQLGHYAADCQNALVPGGRPYTKGDKNKIKGVGRGKNK